MLRWADIFVDTQGWPGGVFSGATPGPSASNCYFLVNLPVNFLRVDLHLKQYKERG